MNFDRFDVEKSILGLLVVFKDELIDNVNVIDVNDFELPLSKSIFTRIKENYKNNFDLNLSVLGSEFSKDETEYLKSCMDIAITVHTFSDNLKRLKELSRKRRIKKAISDLAFDNDVDIIDLQKIIENEESKHLFIDINEKGKSNIDEFTNNLNKQALSIKTGMPTFDKVTNGLRKGTVFIIGARPSVGKTSLAINIANYQSKQNQKALFFSLEMSSEMIFERLMSMRHNINYSKFIKKTLSDSEITTIKKDTEVIKNKNELIVIDDCYTIEEMCNNISQAKPDLVIVDFMQIISTTNKFENVRTKTDYISSEFKKIAKKLNCVVIVLSQLSRNGKDAPTMSDLKESGGLEADGDYIALLHRPYVLNKSDSKIEASQTELLLDKNKFGGCGKIDLHFDLQHQKFEEVEMYREEQRYVSENNSNFDFKDFEEI